MIKKVLFITAVTFSLSLFTISSCTNSSSDGSAVAEQAVAYQCPMDCEDGKTYDAAGQCPVCEMDLVKLEE